MSKEQNEVTEDINFDIIPDVTVDNTVVIDDTTETPVEEKKDIPEAKKSGKSKKDAKPEQNEVIVEPKDTIGKLPEEQKPQEVEESLISGIAKQLGYEMSDEEEYDDTEEGLVQFVQSASDKIADEKLNNWLESLSPTASQFFDYLQMIGPDADEEKIKEYFTAVKPEIDYKSIDLTKEEAQKAVMRTFYKKFDYSDEEIKTAIDDLELAGVLEKQAKTTATKLAAIQEKESLALVENEKRADLERKQKAKQYTDNLKIMIEKGQVKDFIIPVSDKKAILDYISKGDDIKELNEYLGNIENRIQLAIAIKNKFNLSKYVKAAANTKQASTLRDKVKSSVNLKSGAADSMLSDIDLTIVPQKK